MKEFQSHRLQCALKMGSKFKLTKMAVETTKEAGLYWDTELPGFGLCISGKTKSYVVQRRILGKSSRQVIGRHGLITAEEARKLAREKLVQMTNGVDPRAEKRARQLAGTKLGDAYKDYIGRRRLAERTAQDYAGYMRKYFAAWATMPINAITGDMVESLHKQLGQNHGHAQADVAMRLLKAIFNFAEGMYSKTDGTPLVSHNPTKRLSALKQWFRPQGRKSYVLENNFAAWFSAVDELRLSPVESTATAADYLLFLAFTGLRRTEASKLRWSYINFEDRLFRLPAEIVKNGREHVLPLTSVTYDLLIKRQKKATSDFVFQGTGKLGHLVDPRPTMKKVTVRSNVEFMLHDLRRTYATYASAVVDSDWMVGRLMNHSTGRTVTERYLHGIERLRPAAENITAYLLAKAKMNVEAGA
jgi:integrase